MREQLERRLNQLKSEFESGQKILTELDSKQATLRESLLRVSGAIQVLEEELAREGQSETGNVERLNAVKKEASQA